MKRIVLSLIFGLFFVSCDTYENKTIYVDNYENLGISFEDINWYEAGYINDTAAIKLYR